MFGLLKKIFEKPPVIEPFYDIVCPYCFSKFPPNGVVFRAAHSEVLEEDEKLNQYRKRYGLAEIEELEAVIDPSTIAEDKKEYTNGVLTGVTDSHSIFTKTRLCPHCHNDLPITAGKHPSNIISIVGASSVGKSVYITTLIHTLERVTANNFNAACMPLNTSISRRFRDEYEIPLFDHRSLLDATAKTRRQEPFIFQFVFKDDDRHPLTLVFIDVAGEGMTDKEYLQLHASHIKNSAGILFLVDPMQIRTIREKLIIQMGENPGKIVGMSAEPREVVISLYNDFIAHQENSKTDIPTAVVLTKSDLLSSISSEEGDYIRPNSNVFRNVIHKGDLNLDEFENINGEVRRFLSKVDIPFVDAIDVYFRNSAFFAVSSLGSNPVGQQVNGIINPTRVDEPFIWLMYKLGFIEGGHEV